MKLNFQLWNLFIELLEGMWLVRWNLDLTNLYMKKSSVQQTISVASVTVNYTEKNLQLIHRKHTCTLPVPWPFIISKFHCSLTLLLVWEQISYICPVGILGCKQATYLIVLGGP